MELEQVTITQKEFDSLPEYSCSIPTGTTIGKRWKRHDGIFDPTYKGPYYWYIGEYIDIGDPDKVGIRYKKIVAVLRLKALKPRK